MDNMDNAISSLFKVLMNKDTDENTKAWARSELSQILKSLAAPIIFPEVPYSFSSRSETIKK